MTEGVAEYVQFRAKLVRKPRFGEGSDLAGKKLTLIEWTIYDPPELLGRFLGKQRLRVVQGEDLLALEGLRSDGVWAPVSRWLEEEVRRVDLASELKAPREPKEPPQIVRSRLPLRPGEVVEFVVSEMRPSFAGGGHRPGRGESAIHIVRHLGVKDRRVAVAIMLGLGLAASEDKLDDDLRNGRRLGDKCRFAHPLPE